MPGLVHYHCLHSPLLELLKYVREKHVGALLVEDPSSLPPELKFLSSIVDVPALYDPEVFRHEVDNSQVAVDNEAQCGKLARAVCDGLT